MVHELNAQGHEVRALLRPGADRRGLAGARYEVVEGDVLEKSDVLAGLMEGCDWCFHAAASYALWLPSYDPMFKTNVLGTQKILRGALKAGCKRIVYTSTVGCIGLPKERPGHRTIPTDEDSPVSQAQMTNPYKLSKWQAELAAREMTLDGAPIVIVNPTAPVGPRDVKPTPTGQIIVDFMRGALPAYLDTGLNFVHVRDVARGHILAAERGRIGERYILGNADGNWSMREALGRLARLADRRPPSTRIPYPVALGFAFLSEGWAKVSRKPPRAPLAGVRMAKYKMWFNPAKAVRELGLPQTPPSEGLADALAWFAEHGYWENKASAGLKG